MFHPNPDFPLSCVFGDILTYPIPRTVVWFVSAEGMFLRADLTTVCRAVLLLAVQNRVPDQLVPPEP